MFEFECWHENSHGEKWALQRYIAETSAKAKAQHYNYLQDGLFEDDFFTVVRNMKCRKIGRASIMALFGDYNQFKRMCELRNIAFAFQGMRISVAGRMGTIVGSNSSLNLDVVFDGRWDINNCHPHYETIYLDNYGKEVANFCKKTA